jgi:outer membrane receptor protein involved in Fe transport
MRYGGEVRTTGIDLDDWNTPNGNFTFTGRYTGNAIADMLLGYPSQTQRLVGPGVSNLRSWQAAAFVQDEWRVNNRFSLNYGVRYEYQAPSWEENNQWGSFLPELGRPVQVGTEGLQPSIRDYSKANFAPRLGVVYDVSATARGPFAPVTGCTSPRSPTPLCSRISRMRPSACGRTSSRARRRRTFQ